MRNSAIASAPADQPATDWWGNPITQTCNVDWCEGDCVLGGPGELAHHKTIVEMPVADRRVLMLLQQSGESEAPIVYVSTGPSDDHGVEMSVEQATQYFAAGLASVLNLSGHGPSLRSVA